MTAATAVIQDRDITVILPTETPTATIDPQQCQTHNLTEYFAYQKPSGAFVSAIWSHATRFLKPYSSTAASGIRGCPFSESSDWCSLRTSISASCPIGWFKAMRSFSGGATWLNETIISGGCYTEADPTSGSGALGGQWCKSKHRERHTTDRAPRDQWCS
ncbi:hypothetical protein H112_05224 [Trichophyton rubrum D6]|nr:hypothetical protein H100_05246 [Trichophyton rubrum MR850]EZF40745.1 hypothetical protein H102_05236 [Trichophyton rubrum CBS 100081]EZF51362.1 hypothetical protein H103_05235 [Trichophyton rubrum CBS 288.86]EZF62043.1 hypothetical protein H104_05227 [Trichophyton rubrum CBS 289.86]EZF83416.1 hypothetical protein H110_05234 [Trichophyton rubrum MR1448]EZG15645.1 hypothetical protein H107_05366 [Trichophyton rubrum CBS 202.88]KDB32603.1 hypothetical protein H112_05224 [Trichophyton rubrum 